MTTIPLRARIRTVNEQAADNTLVPTISDESALVPTTDRVIGDPMFPQNFFGVADLGTNTLAPSDCNTEVGPGATGVVVHCTNLFMRIFRKDGTQLAQTTMASLLQTLDLATYTQLVTTDGYNGFSDPRVRYDWSSNRFRIVYILFKTSGGEFQNVPTQLVHMTSRGDTPVTFTSADWEAPFVYSDTNTWDGDTQNQLTDYPTLGTTRDYVMVGANLFDANSSATYRGGRMYLFVKNVNGTLGGLFSFRGNSFAPDVGGTPQPAHSYAAVPPFDMSSDTPYFVSSIGGDPSSLRVWRRDVVGGSGWLKFDPTMPAGSPTYSPDSATQTPGGSNPIDSGGDRLMTAIFRNNHIWTCACTGASMSDREPRARWFNVGIKADGTWDNTLDFGTVQSMGISYYYPSLAVNQLNDMVLQYCASSYDLSMAIQPHYSFRDHTLPMGQLSPDMAIPYVDASLQNRPYGSVLAPRWGDYSSTALDPDSDYCFWISNQTPWANSGAGSTPYWATQITKIIFAPDVCVAAGTLVTVLHRSGQLVQCPIEELREGMQLSTGAADSTRLISVIKLPARVRPLICVKEGTFGEGRPSQNLRICKGHPLLVNGREVVPEDLIDGSRVTLETHSEPTEIYTLVTEARQFVLMNGMLVATWSETGWANYLQNDAKGQSLGLMLCQD